MKRLLCAGLVVLSSVAVHASVVGSLATNVSGTALTLSRNNVSGGVLETGSVANVAAEPSGTIGTYLAGEPASTGSAILSFGANGVSNVSFEWGTPDSFNTLVVTQANGTKTDFTAAELGLKGDTKVDFAETGSAITSLTFESTSPAFEAADFVTSAIPEPSSVALLLAGLLGMTYLTARNRSVK